MAPPAGIVDATAVKTTCVAVVIVAGDTLMLTLTTTG